MNWQDYKNITQVDVVRRNHDFQKIGTLTRTKSGSLFEYDDDVFENKTEAGVSFHINKSQKKFETRGYNLHPFFAGLLPEGLRLSVLKNIIKTSEDDLFSLLMGSGKNLIGNLSIIPTGQNLESQLSKPTLKDLEFLKDISFKNFFDHVDKISLKNIRNQIVHFAGVQNKISAQMISLFINFELGKGSRTHEYIVKLNPKKHPTLIQNEHFFMKMARACGLDVASTKLIYDQHQTPALFVERFDRIYKNKKITATHQEDACQFLNVYPADKYRLSFQEIADGFEKWCSAPILEIAKLIHLKAFSYLIGNGDLHAKNISLFTNPENQLVQITPGYDILSTLPYGDNNMALKILGKDKNLNAKIFFEFGKKFKISKTVIKKILESLCDTCLEPLKDLDKIKFSAKKQKFLKDTILKRREELRPSNQ